VDPRLVLPGPDAEFPDLQPSHDRSIGARSRRRLHQLQPGRLLDQVRSAIEVRQDRQELIQLRGGRDVVWDDEDEPLVTVRIATYNAGVRLTHAVNSAIEQTYQRLQILIVGDHCDDQTAEVASSFRDPRVVFINLPRRGQYPAQARKRWMVAGAAPMNVALDLAAGSWIAPCDDDDVMTPDHVEVLLAHALRNRLELAWSRAALQSADGSWTQTRPGHFAEGDVSHGSILYSTGLRFMRYNRRAYLSDKPGDWELWRRMDRAGVKRGFLDRLTYYHFN
jgi:glycosyltransferase involved in cell wall biosynthesis